MQEAHPVHDYAVALALVQTEHLMRDVLNQLGRTIRCGSELTELRGHHRAKGYGNKPRLCLGCQ